ncbi:MAG: PAS domain S-box protein, partial [Thermodesulfobacteriota bacterium]|nr:PAS domain S-box protein [Thermodesulfobacteriota bacterium]
KKLKEEEKLGGLQSKAHGVYEKLKPALMKLSGDAPVVKAEAEGTMLTGNAKLEDELAESQGHFQTLFNIMTDPVVIVDEKGRFLEVTDKVSEFTGFKREELLGKRFTRTDIVTSKSKAIMVKNLAKRIMGMKLAPYEIEVLAKDGKKLPFEINASKIVYKGKSADMVVFRDISKRKQAEEKLLKAYEDVEQKVEERTAEISEKNKQLKEEINRRKRTEERFKMTSDVFTDLIYEWDVRDDTLEWFGDIDSVLGYESGELSRTVEGWVKLIHPEDQEKLKGSVELHRKGTTPIHEEYRVQKKDGTWCYWEDRGIPILDENNRPIRWMGGCTDITDRKRYEKEVKQNVDELERHKNVTIGRELRIVELKKKVKRLEKEKAELYGVEND